MGKWSDPTYTVDEAVLVAEYHDEVDDLLDVYARGSRACTDDKPQYAPTPGWDA